MIVQDPGPQLSLRNGNVISPIDSSKTCEFVKDDTSIPNNAKLKCPSVPVPVPGTDQLASFYLDEGRQDTLAYSIQGTEGLIVVCGRKPEDIKVWDGQFSDDGNGRFTCHQQEEAPVPASSGNALDSPGSRLLNFAYENENYVSSKQTVRGASCTITSPTPDYPDYTLSCTPTNPYPGFQICNEDMSYCINVNSEKHMEFKCYSSGKVGGWQSHEKDSFECIV